MQRYLCAGYPDRAAHSARYMEPDFQEVVRTREDVDGDDIPDPDGSLCTPCNLAKQAVETSSTNARTDMIRSIRNRFVNNGILPDDEARFLVTNIFGEDGGE